MKQETLGEVTLVPVDDLNLHPDNPRQGDVGAIATSIQRNGWFGSLVAQVGSGRVLVGNHRLQAARQLGIAELPVHWVDVDEVTARRILLADNRTSDLASYNDTDLVALLQAQVQEDDLIGTGWDADDLDDLLAEIGASVVDDFEGEVPEPPPDPVTKVGDLILLGKHRLLCGDTTDPANIARLVDGATLTLVHADPPYGMGKENDGILNDNLYKERLDEFQMKWWSAWKPTLAENGSTYIWGTALDLWRLWYAGGMGADPDVTFRNEIVWDKGTGFGMNSSIHHQYPTATERCLFFMLGQQFLGNQNIEDYWEGYEPFRLWIVGERDRAGWSNSDVNQRTGTTMAGHWFSKSQFLIINRESYEVLQNAANGAAFTTAYDDLFAEFFPELRSDGNAYKRQLSAALREGRTTFNNEHDSMTDVWRLSRVHGDDRHGHATPKPVEAMTRVVKSSTNPGDVIGVPFGGTAPEIVAAEQLDRRCVIAEIDPGYCDVIVERWEKLTGLEAVRP